MLTSDLNVRPTGKEGSDQVEKYRDMRENWVKFCLFPDIVEPCRMPALFPIPTHLFKRQAVATIALPAANAGWNIRALWKPDNSTVLSGQFPVFVWRAVNPGDAGYNNIDHQNDDTAPTIVTAPLASVYTQAQAINIPGIGPEVANGGARLIGAFVELEYIGTLENHSGTIEVGLIPNSRDDLTSHSTLHFASDTEIIQLPFYRRYKPMDGARCIWFPIDSAAFNFKAGGQNMSQTTIGFANSPVTVEWAINLNGLQAGQAVRVHVCNVYESVPDELSRDLFLPKHAPPQNMEGSKQAIQSLVQQGVATTPSKSSSAWGSVYNGLHSLANSVINNSGAIATGLSMAKDFMPMISKFI